MADLQVWCKENRLKFKKIGDRIVEIADKKYVQVIGEIEGKLLDSELNFIFKPEELLDIINEEISSIVFEFGQKFYYTEFDYNKFFDKFIQDNVTAVEVQFNDLKFLGKAEQSDTRQFPQLGIHSEYEILNGSSQSKAWVTKAKFLGCNTIAISDLNTLGGTLDFQIAAADKGLKCILGMTANVRHVFKEGRQDEFHEVKLYAKNEKGWRNLLRINTQINVENKGSHIDEKMLLKFGEGVILVISTNSMVNRAEEVHEVDTFLRKYRNKFDAIYYQFDSVEFKSDDLDLELLVAYKRMKEFFWDDVPFVLINDSYYIDQADSAVKKYLNTIKGIAQPESDEQHMKCLDEVKAKIQPFFGDEDEFNEFFDALLANTNELADSCSFQIPTGQHKLPKYEAVTLNECHFDEKLFKKKIAEFEKEYGVDSSDNEELFYKLIELGVEEKLGEVDDIEKYYARIEKEATVIVGAGFIDYFLILWDLIKWAKSDNIRVGVGRGSVGGSLLAYLLDITDIDPIQYDLLFERFLNETRVSGERAKAADALPDIDLDFESRRRDDVKKYLEFKYGYDRVCTIGTYNGLKLKSAVTEFGKVNGLQFAFLKFMTSLIGDQLKYDWKDLFKYALKEKPLMEFVQKNYEAINLMKPILNQAQSKSIHASAVIIVPKEDAEGNPMTVFDWMPIKWVEKDGKEFLVSEWAGKFIDRAGFLKEDILGLDQLDKFANISDLIKKNRGEEVVLRDIPLDDPLTYKFFRKGWSEDIFQFNSSGLKNFLRKVLPDNIDELTAINALWRPGPMGSNAHVDFYEIKHGKKKAVFDYGLKDVTDATYGLYVYQEQIMRAVNVLGNLTLTESDEVRTVMKKFDKVKMKTYRDKFIAGALANGCGQEEAEKIWDKLDKFSGYGFNKSHSAAYALMAYWAQWLKANYPVEFWTTALQFAKEAEDVTNIISELRQVSNIVLKSPNINKSEITFVGDIKEESIYWSLIQIKNIGVKNGQKIVDVRNTGGEFTSLQDFLNRMKGTGVGKDKLKYLILAGAFDELCKIKSESGRKNVLEKYYALCGEELPEIYNTEQSNEDFFWIILQKQLTGFGTIDFKAVLNDHNSKLARKYLTPKSLQKSSNWDEGVVGGQIMMLTSRTPAKKGSKEFCVVTLQNNNDILISVLWNETWSKYKDELKAAEGTSKVIFINGKVKYDDYRGYNVLYSGDDTKIIIL